MIFSVAYLFLNFSAFFQQDARHFITEICLGNNEKKTAERGSKATPSCSNNCMAVKTKPRQCEHSIKSYTVDKIHTQDDMLSQGEPRDAAISFDTTASCMRLLWYMSIYND